MWWMLWGALWLGSPSLEPAAVQATAELERQGAVPEGTWVEQVYRSESGPVRVVLGVDSWWLEAMGDGQLDQVIAGFAHRFGRGVSVEVWALDPDSGVPTPLPLFLPPVPPVPARPWEATLPLPARPVVVPAEVPGGGTGFLTGKHVYVSQGHGWTWTDALGAWSTQRGNTWGVVEDFLNAEAINQYLIPYLKNAGATVFPMRESDMNPALVIVDNDDGTSHPEMGTYEEIGSFETSTAGGFGPFEPPYLSGVALFSAGSTRYAWTAPGSTTLARFTPNLPKAGTYTVSLTWAASENRTSSAKVVVKHAGGETQFLVDQKRHGSTWIVLGRFYFEAGSNPQHGAVEVVADAPSEGAERVISVDAVKFGGGMGLIQRGDGSGVNNGPTSGRPRWEENCRYAAQFHGAPTTVYDASATDGNDDVGARSRYSAWQHEEGEDAVYFSWHTNAPSPATGTSTYVYGPNEPDGQYIFTGTAGSDKMAEFIHNEIVNDIRSEYDANWDDLGRYTAWFGELNPAYNAEMPAVLTEVGFHDTESDCLKMQDPKFRALVARAAYQGIVKFFAWKDGTQAAFLPDAPVEFSVATLADGRTKLTWSPAETGAIIGSDPAVSYRLYTSLDGRAFDNGQDLGSETEAILDSVPVGTTVYFRVTAVNPGGESFPTPTLATRKLANSKRGALVVGGFDRIDRLTLIPEDLSAYGLSTVQRMYLDRINRYDYVVEHARALEKVGMPFDSCWHDAKLVGQELASYPFVDWFVGRDSTADETLSDAERELVQAYLQGGGKLLLSGSEIGWDLVEKGTQAEQAWFEEWLHATYVKDDADTHQLAFEGTTLQLDDGTMGTYNARYPDVIGPVAGGNALVHYGDGTTVAGTSWNSSGGPGVALLGFPLETVVGDEPRALLLNAVMVALEVSIPADDPVEPSPEPVDGVVEAEDTQSPPDVQESVSEVETKPDETAEEDLAKPDATAADQSEPERDVKDRDLWITTNECHSIGGCTSSAASADRVSGLGVGILSLLWLAVYTLARRRRSSSL